ncbi:MAG TPA: ATPase, T2SS/T4P/T4SS family [Chroococcales cyanobacterium]
MSVPSYFSPVAKILIEAGYLNPRQMQQAIAKFRESGRSIAQGGLSFMEILESIAKKPLPDHLRPHLLRNFSYSSSSFAEKLIQSGYVDRNQMESALAENRRSGKPLTEVIESMTGRKLPPDLLRQSKKQLLFELKIIYSVESLDPDVTEINTDIVSHLIKTLIPIDICSRYRVVPVGMKETRPPTVLVAMVDPDHLDAQDDLMRILRPQGIALQRTVITQEDYRQLISQYRDEKLERDRQAEFQRAVDVKQDLENIDSFDSWSDEPEAIEEVNLKGAEDAPVINLVNRILAKALQEGASDIHIEPQENNLCIRFRKDGVLQQAFDPLPKKITLAVAARCKIIADLDITERRLPQHGKIRRMFQNRRVDFRLSTLPSRYGETIVLRIIDDASTQLGLDKLITDSETLRIIREMAHRPFGLLLVTGATGSGKSTTLYSILRELNNIGVNICTAEDPIEYSIPGVTQVQVLREKGMDFASILQAFLRQDPDVILVGEIRDKETAKTALEAAITGHLVLTVLHANDTAEAIVRLNRRGVESFMLADALIGVIAQRLMRRVCPNCRISYHPTADELARFGWSTSGEADLTLYRAKTLRAEEIREARETETLCPTCYGLGYKGRVAIYEVIRVSDQIRTLINKEASTEQLKEAAMEEGMKTLLAFSFELVRDGYTTLAEVERVTFSDSALEAELKIKRQSTLKRPSSPDLTLEERPVNPRQKLQELEKQLEAIAHQFQQLKKELESDLSV